MSPSERVKSLIGYALNGVPFTLQRRVLESVLNGVFRDAIGQGELDYLEDRCVGITVDDFNIDIRIGLCDGRLRRLPATASWDVHIAGDAGSFLAMAAGREDPDTLFFQRRLKIEGDTELGLAVKNTMDSIGTVDLSGLLRRF